MDIVIFQAGMIAWLVVAVFLFIQCRVWSPAKLRLAPARTGKISLLAVASVFLVYLFAMVVVVVGAAQFGLARPTDLGATPPAASSPVAPAPESAAAPATATAAASVPAASVPAANPPAGTAAAVPDDNASYQKDVTSGAVISVLYALLAGPVIVVIARMFPGGSRTWGIHYRQIPAGVAAGLLGFVISFPMLLLSEYVLSGIYDFFGHTMSEHPTMQALDQAALPLGQRIFLIALAAVVAPFAEELFFRGILQTALVQRAWGLVVPQMAPPGAYSADYRPSVAHRVGAILLASLAFGYVHQLDQAPIIFLLALCLGYVYERTGNLWAAITLHAAFNGAEIGLDKLFHAMGVS